jgi:hypothetical protein
MARSGGQIEAEAHNIRANISSKDDQINSTEKRDETSNVRTRSKGLTKDDQITSAEKKDEAINTRTRSRGRTEDN